MRFKVLLALVLTAMLFLPLVGGYVGSYMATVWWLENKAEPPEPEAKSGKPELPPEPKAEPEPPGRTIPAGLAASKPDTQKLSWEEWAEQAGLSAYQRGQILAKARRAAESLPGWGRTREQGVMLARIAANENTRVLRPYKGGGTDGAFTQDTHAIAEVVANNQFRLLCRRQTHCYKPTDWGEVMGELAPHVTGVVEPKDGKQHNWAANLPEESCKQPIGWIPAQHGNWDIYGPNWCTFRDAVATAWVEGGFIDVPGTPIGWGNEEDLARAVKRGMCVIPGLGDRNGFVARPGNGCQREAELVTMGG